MKRGLLPFSSVFFALLLSISAITYLPEDGITTLNSNDFNSTISSSGRAWVVEFFSHTCGHCIEFAPIFTNFARNAIRWSSVVSVGAVTSVDRQFFQQNSVNKFPTIKLYLPWAMGGVIDMEGSTVEELNESLLNALRKASNEGMGLDSWPNINFVVDIEGMQNEALLRQSLLHLLVVEDDIAQQLHLGELVIMDNSALQTNMSLLRSHVDIASQHNMKTPGLYLLIDQQFVQMPGIYNRSGLNDVIENLINIRFNVTLNHTFSSPYYGSNIINLTVSDDTYVYRPAHGLRAQDLLAGLRHTLWQEVAGVESIEGASLQALKEYLLLLRRYLPVDQHVTNFLELLLVSLNNHVSLNSQQWLDILNSTQSDLAYIPSEVGWEGCKGSVEHLRGYPCSMWMTFHAISVAAVRKPHDLSNKTGLHTLITIRNYMQHFFSCEYCRLHFLQETSSWPSKLLDPQSVWSDKRAVLTLWQLHNSANTRLHHSPLTEDPYHPKIQFPAREDCPGCRQKEPDDPSPFQLDHYNWNLERVFEFLVDYYGQAGSSSCKDKGMKVMVTSWSSCSRSCDTGVSVRMSSNNSECQLRLQTRLCIDVPCSLSLPPMQDCIDTGRIYRLGIPLHLKLLNCTSEALQDWKVCGKCFQSSTGTPLCCHPSATSNKKVRMTCDKVQTSKVDDDGGVWLNQKTSVVKVATTMTTRVVDMCSCSLDFC